MGDETTPLGLAAETLTYSETRGQVLVPSFDDGADETVGVLDVFDSLSDGVWTGRVYDHASLLGTIEHVRLDVNQADPALPLGLAMMLVYIDHLEHCTGNRAESWVRQHRSALDVAATVVRYEAAAR